MFRNNLLPKNTVGESGAPSLLQKEKRKSAKFDVSKVLFPDIGKITNPIEGKLLYPTRHCRLFYYRVCKVYAVLNREICYEYSTKDLKTMLLSFRFFESRIHKSYEILQYFLKIFLRSETIIPIFSLKMLFSIFYKKAFKNICEGVHS